MRRANFLTAASLPRTRVEVGMTAVAPLAAVRERPVAVAKLAAVMGSKRKTGCAMVLLNRHMATVNAIKPWKENENH